MICHLAKPFCKMNLRQNKMDKRKSGMALPERELKIMKSEMETGAWQLWEVKFHQVVQVFQHGIDFRKSLVAFFICEDFHFQRRIQRVVYFHLKVIYLMLKMMQKISLHRCKFFLGTLRWIGDFYLILPYFSRFERVYRIKNKAVFLGKIQKKIIPFRL